MADRVQQEGEPPALRRLQLLQQLARARVQRRRRRRPRPQPALPGGVHGPEHGEEGPPEGAGLLAEPGEPVLQAKVLRQLRAARMGRLDHRAHRVNTHSGSLVSFSDV